MQADLQLKGIYKSFSLGSKKIPVLEDVSFSARRGEIVAILGRSGSGKTTLLNIICRIENADVGTSTFAGQVSYTPQKDLLLPWRTVENNILLPFEIKKSLTDNVKTEVNRLIKEYGIEEFKNTYPSNLSGGMRQKVALIRSLVQDTEAYLFDEALSAIDFDSRIKLVESIRNFILSKNKIGIFVTHNIEEAIAVADKIVVLSQRPARVVFEGSVALQAKERGPVEIRKSNEFQRLFDVIWNLISKS